MGSDEVKSEIMVVPGNVGTIKNKFSYGNNRKI